MKLMGIHSVVAAIPLFLLPGSLFAAVSPTFTVSDETVAPGGTVTVSVGVKDFADVTSFQFSLAWNDSVLSFVSAANTTLLPTTLSTANPSTSRLTVLWSPDDTNPH